MTRESDFQSDVKAAHKAQSPRADPLVGTAETTDSAVEAGRAPSKEVMLDTPPQGRAHRSRGVAGALGIFLGGLGAHRFYLGFTRIGLAQLAVTVGAGALAVLTCLAMDQTLADALLVGSGVAMLGVLWGLFEGIAILAGLLGRDAEGHPLSKKAPRTAAA